MVRNLGTNHPAFYNMSLNKNLKESGYLGAIALERTYPRSISGLVCLFLFVSFVLLAALSLLPDYSYLLLFSKIIAAFFLVNMVYWLFVAQIQEEKARTSEQVVAIMSSGNFGMLLNFRSAFAIKASLKSDGFLLPLNMFKMLSGQPCFELALKRLGISKDDFFGKLNGYYPKDFSINATDLMALAAHEMALNNKLGIDLHFILSALYDLDDNFNRMMFDHGIKKEDWVQAFSWIRRQEYRLKKDIRFWDEDSLVRTKGIGKDWSSGYTPNLDRIGKDITSSVSINRPPHIYGHRRYIDQIEQFLVDGMHNVVLVGEPGVGRHTIIQNFAMHINAGEVFHPLQYIRLVQIDTSSILSASTAQGSIIDRIRLVFTEALWSGNVILVVNNIDAFLDPEPEVGRVNATEALLPFLKSRLKVIGLTTKAGYQQTIGKNAELVRWFGKVEIREPDFSETLAIVEDRAINLERRSGLFFTLSSLKEIVSLSTKLIQVLPNPEKSLEILESVAIYTKTLGKGVVGMEEVQHVISERTHIPVEKVAGQEKETLLNMEQLLHQRVIGQDEAIVRISDALRRARSGVRSESRPIGSFLFLGPTGVGKTETTKALASAYFGSEKSIIRLDMSEYQEVRSINRLIGEKGDKRGGYLTEAVMESPFSVVLLDEIEKAHPKILDLFLQVLDEGWLTDALGRKIDFTNTMVIATSNAGSELIRESVKGKKELLSDDVVDYIQKNNSFRPEFINRFDGVVVFKPLTKEQLLKVARLVVNDLNKRLRPKEVSIRITKELLEYIVSNAYSPEFGARPLKRFVQEKIENYIARGLIEGSIKRGQEVELFEKALV
jgi:ATP-dependent Clp protease ATP-binding subunit ClpC